MVYFDEFLTGKVSERTSGQLYVAHISAPSLRFAMRRRNSVWAAGLLWLSTPACATDAAVALLADGANPATTDAMLRNLATLARTCDWARRYDVIVFHEGGAAGDALRPRLAALRRRTGLRLRARDVSDVFAAPAPAFVDRPRRRGQRTFGLGYRRMCRFWFSGVFELADVRNLTYLMRLDTDSELRCRADSRDPFEVMARRRAIYGYVAVKMDHQRVARNLTAFGAAYARRVPQIQDAFFRFPPNAHKNCPAPMFYTNFEIMDVSWFVQPRAVALARAVDASGSRAVKIFLTMRRRRDAPRAGRGRSSRAAGATRRSGGSSWRSSRAGRT